MNTIRKVQNEVQKLTTIYYQQPFEFTLTYPPCKKFHIPTKKDGKGKIFKIHLKSMLSNENSASQEMNGNEEPIEIKVEPEIHDLLPFEDFDIDQFVDYLQNDEEIAGNNLHLNESSPSPNHQSGYVNNFTHEATTQSTSEKFFYTCTVCREILGNSQELLNHVRTHTSMKVYNSENSRKNSHGPKCSICHRKFSDLRNLSTHEKTQHLPPFKCRFCGAMFSLLKYYKVHLNLHSNQKHRSNVRVPESKMNNNKQWNKSSTSNYRSLVQTSNQGLSSQLNQQTKHHLPQLLRCKYCHKQFSKLSSFKKHQMLHETVEDRSSVQVNPELQSQSISRTSNEFSHVNQSSSSSLNKSGSLTLTPSLLSNLNKLANLSSTDSRDGKKPAILININTNDPSMKDDCSSKSQEMPVGSNNSGLMISSVSTMDKKCYDKNLQNPAKATVMIQNGKKAISLSDLQCPICKKIVSQPFSLKIHLRTHTMERPFTCTVCGKKFSQSCNLKTHMKTHSIKRPQQQPMQCNICNKVFSRASSLNSHMISHTAKLYCYACNINFEDDVLTYSQHMQSQHLVTMTKDCMSRTRINLQQQQNESQLHHRSNESLASIVKVEPNETFHTEDKPQQRLMEVFQVQSSSVTNGQIPKLKITIKKEPMQENNSDDPPKHDENDDGNESDSSSSSDSSDSSSSSSNSSSSSSSTSSDSKDDQDNK
ncbi:CLUMA_CG004342, isoform A [Clunio marinus]|uniref:CLUMA_CG004342, isoform A n=1 Tax=Clunio marinus TaxID=568069 RepID=A0A1J1HRN6_9DIPT|nr:CLUMA_CG004342, isoform A [Clunio marinus]